MDVAHAIAQVLKQEGVEFVFGYPVNPIIEAAAEADIRTVIVRQERVGVHMADALARVSSGERPAVFVMQHGPGTENAFGGIAQAYSESVPMLVIPAGYPRRIAHVHPNFNAHLNFRHVSKWSEPLTMGKAVPEVMRRAFSQLRNGRPGPVLVEIPLDVFREEVPERFEHFSAPAPRTAPDPESVEQIAGVLAQAERPVIYAGQGVHYAKAWHALEQFAERMAIPVCTSLEGKSAFREDHPLALGAGGMAVPRPVRHFLDEADVIFGVGCSFSLTAFGVSMPRDKTVIHATLDPMDLNKDVPAHYGLVGDARLVLEALDRAAAAARESHATTRRRETLADEITAVRESWLEQWRPKLTSDAKPISPYRVIGELMKTVDPAEVIVTHDAGSPRDQLSPFWTATEPLSYLGWGKTTQLGYGLGLAMGAKLAQPEKLCINLWGDAAIGFTGMDFETAARERIPILSILFNNFSMAIEIPIMQAATEKYRATDISGHYADFARALGGYGERVDEPGDVAAALARGIAATRRGEPALLEFITAQETEISRG